MNTDDLHEIASGIDSHGSAAMEPAIIEMIGVVRDAGLDGVALSVLSDPTEPEVARLRAFGIVASQYAELASRPAPAASVARPAALAAGVG